MAITALFILALAPMCADAAPHAKHTTPTKQAVESEREARQALVIAHIKQQLGEYGSSIVADPRFAIDPTMFIPKPHPKPTAPPPRPRRYDYDYVFSAWSKEQGRKFLENNDIAFDYAERNFGVPREVINAVLNIETQWGQSLGKRPVIVTLYTLAVMRPDRIKQGWPEKELIAFLRIFRESDIDPFSIQGSFTGAFGLPQFEPTSYSTLAVSCGDNDPPNLFGNDDAICSIANYLHRAGWNATEQSRKRALLAYNRDTFYAAAILDYADWLAGRQPKHPRYRFFHQ